MKRVSALLGIGLMLLPGLSAPARAGDYTIFYAIELDGKTASGRMDACDYTQTCYIDVDGLHVVLFFIPFDLKKYHRIRVDIAGRAGCCYFSGGDKQRWFDAGLPLLRAGLYAGRARRGAELIENPSVGTLYLRVFHPHVGADPDNP